VSLRIMQLSDIEKRIVARLRRRQAQMVRARWWLLLGGVCMLGASACGFWFLLPYVREPAPALNSVMIVACYLPQLYLCALFGLGMIADTWLNWNGNPRDRLLLRLIDEKFDT